ncbi:hypothetical protein PG991_005101 [Apiospora marii]|uniref:Uncharacterized protein n=1 Tax=Apiospora marii TaxID=335849 RepID=A0ABR1S878_9PEZI
MPVGQLLRRTATDDPCTDGDCHDLSQPLSASDSDSATSVTEISSVGPPATASLTTGSTVAVTESAVTTPAEATSTDTADDTPTPTATTITIPPPRQTGSSTSTPLSSNNTGDSFTLGRAEIAGISVGGVIGGLLLLFVIFLVIRRRKLAKRMPSFVNARGRDQFDEKLMHNSQNCAMGARSESNGEDVFAPFGGRANSPVRNAEQGSDTPSKRLGNTHDSMRSTGGHSFLVSPITPTNTGRSACKDLPGDQGQCTIEEEQPDSPAQLDSRPVYIELDSRDTERQRPAELPTTSGFPSIPRPKSTSDVLRHPGLLTPGTAR